MIYRALRWISGVALHWFYRDIRVRGLEHVPSVGPLIIAVNHHNALVDSLIAGVVIPRKIAMTAKATVVDNPLIAFLFRLLHVVPLKRSSDELECQKAGHMNSNRNNAAFADILDLLSRGGAVLIFPEGKSHNEHRLEPLKTGLARIALEARDRASVRHVRILPVGLVFEDKGKPGTLVGVNIAAPIDVDDWSGEGAKELTEVVGKSLRKVYESGGIADPSRGNTEPGWFRRQLILIAARWGRLTHHMPVTIARKIALRRSTDEDEPAMFTIVFGVALVILTYAIHVTLVGLLLHSVLITVLYLASLVCGAYWAAYEGETRFNS